MKFQIQSGSMVKPTEQSIQINFNPPFEAVPIVLTTPNFPTSVGAPDNVTEISSVSCTIASLNFGSNYFVNWVAVTPGAFELTPDAPE